MRRATSTSLSAWYSEVFDIGLDDLRRSVTAHHHTKLGDSPGYYVVWRGAGVHVSLPDAAEAETTRCLSRQAAGVLRGSV